jgi:hypothetical protein
VALGAHPHVNHKATAAVAASFRNILCTALEVAAASHTQAVKKP